MGEGGDGGDGGDAGSASGTGGIGSEGGGGGAAGAAAAGEGGSVGGGGIGSEGGGGGPGGSAAAGEGGGVGGIGSEGGGGGPGGSDSADGGLGSESDSDSDSGTSIGTAALAAQADAAAAMAALSSQYGFALGPSEAQATAAALGLGLFGIAQQPAPSLTGLTALAEADPNSPVAVPTVAPTENLPAISISPPTAHAPVGVPGQPGPANTPNAPSIPGPNTTNATPTGIAPAFGPATGLSSDIGDVGQAASQNLGFSVGQATSFGPDYGTAAPGVGAFGNSQGVATIGTPTNNTGAVGQFGIATTADIGFGNIAGIAVPASQYGLGPSNAIPSLASQLGVPTAPPSQMQNFPFTDPKAVVTTPITPTPPLTMQQQIDQKQQQIDQLTKDLQKTLDMIDQIPPYNPHNPPPVPTTLTNKDIAIPFALPPQPQQPFTPPPIPTIPTQIAKVPQDVVVAPPLAPPPQQAKLPSEIPTPPVPTQQQLDEAKQALTQNLPQQLAFPVPPVVVSPLPPVPPQQQQPFTPPPLPTIPPQQPHLPQDVVAPPPMTPPPPVPHLPQDVVAPPVVALPPKSQEQAPFNNFPPHNPYALPPPPPAPPTVVAPQPPTPPPTPPQQTPPPTVVTQPPFTNLGVDPDNPTTTPSYPTSPDNPPANIPGPNFGFTPGSNLADYGSFGQGVRDFFADSRLSLNPPQSAITAANTQQWAGQIDQMSRSMPANTKFNLLAAAQSTNGNILGDPDVQRAIQLQNWPVVDSFANVANTAVNASTPIQFGPRGTTPHPGFVTVQ